MLMHRLTQLLPSLFIVVMVAILYMQHYVYIQNKDDMQDSFDRQQHVNVLSVLEAPQIEKKKVHSVHLHRQKRGRLETNAPKHEMDYGVIDYTNNEDVLKITASDRPLFFVIFVHSAFQHFALRNSIRKTWGSVKEQKDKNFKLYFIVGEPDTEYLPLYERFLAEKELKRDIVHTNITDSYINLTLKCIFMFKWCNENCNEHAQFIIKMDDDVFLNIPNLKSKLHKYRTMYNTNDIPIIGHLIEDGIPIRERSSKYYVPKTFYSKTTYPSYVSGSTYIIPKHVIPKLLSVVPKGLPFWLEDIYITGMLTKVSNISLLHDKGFIISKNMVTNVLTEVCKEDVITLHQVTSEEMSELWQIKKNC